jgi:hypothetical protein
MILAIIIAVIFLSVMLFAIRVALSRTSPVEEEEDAHNPLIHASGIYSILRKSPGDAVLKIKPKEQEIRKYLSDLNENLSAAFKENEIEDLIHEWNVSVGLNVKAVEDGDKNNIEFYYFDFNPVDCPICDSHIKKGQFVTREEIFKHPEILPPFHLGCTTKIVPHHGKEDLRETTEIGMMPWFKQGVRPALPDWKNMPKQQTIRGSK